MIIKISNLVHFNNNYNEYINLNSENEYYDNKLKDHSKLKISILLNDLFISLFKKICFVNNL